MAFWDHNGENFNIKFPTMGGEYCWTDLDEWCGYRLQQLNSISCLLLNLEPSHCRILDPNNERIANGDEGSMRAKFRKIKGRDRAEYGDVIGVHRVGGLYDHYGVYEDDFHIYEYNTDNLNMNDCVIRVTTLERFIGNSGGYFVLEFPSENTLPGKVEIPITGALKSAFDTSMLDLFFGRSYRLYSPSDTIKRAKTRLGEQQYNLVFSNCEHFAIWCKTGISQSHQVDSLLGRSSKRNL